MTNAKKFEEVFGIKVNDMRDPCGIADNQICVDVSDCGHCPLRKFWEKQYREKKPKKEENNK